ncbi:hypothetical protein PMm318_A40690 [Pseudomonas moorei]
MSGHGFIWKVSDVETGQEGLSGFVAAKADPRPVKFAAESAATQPATGAKKVMGQASIRELPDEPA